MALAPDDIPNKPISYSTSVRHSSYYPRLIDAWMQTIDSPAMEGELTDSIW